MSESSLNKASIIWVKNKQVLEKNDFAIPSWEGCPKGGVGQTATSINLDKCFGVQPNPPLTLPVGDNVGVRSCMTDIHPEKPILEGIFCQNFLLLEKEKTEDKK
jgi:hypothetical protein